MVEKTPHQFPVLAALVRAANRGFGARDWLEVKSLAVCIPDLAPEFDGYRIALFSDLHFDGLITTSARLRELVAHVNAQQPDLIAFTGDFVTQGVAFRPEDLIIPLRDLCARDARLAVTGNHEYFSNVKAIQRVIRESGMIDLDNAVYTIRRGDACLHVAGVGSLSRHRARLDRVMNQLPASGTAILLAHEPQFIHVSAATERFALQLSGHTHGGQIRLPLLTRLYLPDSTRHYLTGAYYVEETLLYVNRGIGTVGLPLRINCRSELTIIKLLASESLDSLPSRPA